MRTGAYRFPPMDSVIYGCPFAEALREQVEASGANSVFLLASGTLNRETGLVEEVRRALGNRLAGVHAKIGTHTLDQWLVQRPIQVKAAEEPVHPRALTCGAPVHAEHVTARGAGQSQQKAPGPVAVRPEPPHGERDLRERSPV